MGSVGVVVAHHDPAVAERVAELLERAPDLFVAATSMREARAGHVVVAGGDPLAIMTGCAHPLVVLAEDRAVMAGRRAIELAAREIVDWPSEAERLAGAVRRAAAPSWIGSGMRGRVIAVMGARGGLGTSTIVALVAASRAEAVVVDLSCGAGQRAFCETEPARTLHDLVLDRSDPAPEAIEASLVSHAGGSRCLHARPFAGLPASASLVVRAVRSLANLCVVDAGLVGSDAARAVQADAMIVVAGNDVASVRAALAAAPSDPTYVIRRMRRGGVPVRDVAAALGVEEPVVIGHDPALARAVDLGELPRGSRISKRIAALLEAVR